MERRGEVWRVVLSFFFSFFFFFNLKKVSAERDHQGNDDIDGHVDPFLRYQTSGSKEIGG